MWVLFETYSLTKVTWIYEGKCTRSSDTMHLLYALYGNDVACYSLLDCRTVAIDNQTNSETMLRTRRPTRANVISPTPSEERRSGQEMHALGD